MRLRTLPFAAALSAFISLTATSANATVAVRANDFLNSIGVNTHISQGVDSTPKVIPALSYTGAQHPGWGTVPVTLH
jgi:hypothetical protein